MARTITTRLAIEGESEYKAKIKNINAELSLHKSELEKVQAEYKNSVNSMAALTAKHSALEGQMKALNQKHDEQAEMLEKAQKAQKEYSDQVEELRKRLDEVKNSSADTTEEEKRLNEEIAAAEEGLQKATNSATYYQRQLNITERDQANLSAELEQTERYLDEARASADGCAKSIDEYGKEVKEAGEESEDFGDKSANAFNALASALVASGVVNALGEVVGFLKECVSAAAGFEEAMSTVKAISGASAAEFQQLSDMAKQMGETTKFTASESAEAFQYMALAGWKTEEMLDGIAPILNLATAANMDLARASDIVTDNLTAFGLTAADSAGFVDQMAYAMANSNTSADQLGEAYKGCAATAQSMGYSVEDTTAALMVMADAGTKGSDAGTALNAIMTRLATDTKDCASTLEEYGVHVYDAQGNMQSLSSILEGVSGVWGTLTDQQQASLAKAIAGTNHYSQLQQIMTGCSEATKETGKSFTDYAAALEDCSGSADRMAGTMLDNLNGKMTLMNSALDSLKISIGNALMPVLGGLADAGADAFSWAAGFVEENPWLVQAITGALGAVLLLAGGLTTYTAIATAAKLIQDALNLSISLCPFVAAAAAAGALIAVVGSWIISATEASEQVKELTAALEESKTAYEELSAAMEEEHASTAASLETLENLLAVEEKSATQKEIIKQLVDELNEAVPDLGLAYDETADSINMTTDALGAMIEKSAEQEEMEAAVTRLKELQKEGTVIAQELEQAENALNEAREAGARFTMSEENSVKALTAAQEENAAQIAELEAATADYMAQQEATDQKTQEATRTVDGLISEMNELRAAYEESYNAAMESIDGQLGLFNELDGSAKTSIDNLIGTLQGQVSYMETYAANIQKAMELGVDEGLIKKLSDGSEESAQILAAIVEGGEEDIAALNEQLAKVEKGKEAFSETVAEMETDFDEKMKDIEDRVKEMADELDASAEAQAAGMATIDGYIDGAESMRSSLVSTYRSLADAANNAYKSTLEIHSPSRVFKEDGKNTIRGAIEGAEEEGPNLERTYSTLAASAIRAYEKSRPSGTEAGVLTAQREQTAAIVAAVRGQDGGTPGGIAIYVDKLEVRDDQDVERVARELYYLTEQKKRSRGGGSL